MTEVALDPHTFGAEQPCFGCAPAHPIGFKLQFARDGDEVVTRFVPRVEWQGPPGIMHGGLAMAVADELAAWTIIGQKGRLGFTASATTRLRRPLRIGQEVVGRGRIVEDRGRVLKIAVTLRQADEDALTAELTFALLDEGGATRLLGAPLPESWKRFCR
jgi:acyl-coenzyme A thioesterase PaaI-like protein